MTLDTRLRAQLTTAVADTTAPPGLARAALAGGRRRRRRRTTGALALATAAVVGGVLLVPDGGPRAVDEEVASGGGGEVMRAAGMAWARSLPEGKPPALPFFGEGDALWSDGRAYDVPPEVNRSMAPRAVDGGWLVYLGDDYPDMRLAVLDADGRLTPLPPGPGGLDVPDAVAVSADGGRVAYDSLLVDLATMDTTELPHAPEQQTQDGYYTDVRVVGFTDAGLVYEASPYEQGLGTTWLLRDDGTTVPLDPPGHLGDESPADAVVTFDYSDDKSDTCVTSYVLDGESWDVAGEGCMGQYLGEALTTSPDHQWLVTDDLPRVWNLADGKWGRVDMPDGIGPEQMMAQGGGAVWEGDDTFLLPIADRWTGPTSPEPTFDQVVQVVRCSLATGACERAGDRQRIHVVSTMWDDTTLKLAAQ
jgi:hypothetical protein